MFHKTDAQHTKSKRELKQIGQRLRKLITQNDAASLTEALQIIEVHQNDTEVINAQRFHQSTPLMLACEFGKEKIAKKLLATKCIDVNLTGKENTNALEISLKTKHYKIAYLLARDMRVNINASGAKRIHPAFHALMTFSDCPFVIAHAIISRPDMDLSCEYDHTSGSRVFGDHHYYHRTILHSLVHELSRSLRAAKYAKGAEREEVIAREKDNYETGIALLKHVLASGKVDINAFEISHQQHCPRYAKTALMAAVTDHATEIVSILLAAGADPELRNESGLRAIDIAKEHSTDINMYGENGCALAREIYELIKGYKHQPAVRQCSLSMFGSLNNIPNVQPVPVEYLVPPPPQPSAPPEEDDVDCPAEKSALRM